MAGGDHARRRCAPTPPPRQRLEAGGGYRWRDDVLAVLARPRLRRRARRAAALDLLRRRADPRLAGPRARHPPRPAAPRRADQPPRHPLAGVARGLPGRPRRRRRPRRPRPLVPRGGRHLGARAGGAARPLLRRPLARLAQGAGGARDRPRQGDRAPAGGDRADGALRRALPLQGDEGAAGAVAGQADRAGSSATAPTRRTARQPQPALLLQAAGAARAGRAETGQRRRIEVPGRTLLDERRTSKSSAASTSSSSAPTAPARRP